MGITFNPFTGTLDFTGGAGGGGGTPSAPDTSVQFNDGGSFGGDAAFTYDKVIESVEIGTNYAATISAFQPGIAIGSNPSEGQGAALWLGSDDENTGAPTIIMVSSNGTTSAPTASTANNTLGLFNVQGYAGGIFREAAELKFQVADVVGSDLFGRLAIEMGEGSAGAQDYLILDAKLQTIAVLRDVVVSNGKALKTDTTTAHTAILQAFDVDGAAYSTFATLLNGNVPRFTISQPAGGVLAMIAPTADPGVSGALWNDGGAPAFSA